jgi:opacity protein-like surface antigen
MKKLLLLSLSTLAMSAHAWQPTYYLGSGFSSWQLSPHEGTSSTFSIRSLEGMAGVELTPYTAVEVRLGAGVSSSRVYIRNENGDISKADMEVPYYASLYFKPQIRNEKASLYGLLGYTSMDLSIGEGVALDDSFADLSLGIGVTFAINEHFDFNAEWKKLIMSEDFDMRGSTIGFTYRF